MLWITGGFKAKVGGGGEDNFVIWPVRGSGIFAVNVWFQICDQFWISYRKLHNAWFCFFIKPQNRFIWRVSVFWNKKVFSRGFKDSIGSLSSITIFYWVELLYARYVRKSSSCLRILDNFLRNCCFVLHVAITCAREHSKIGHTRTSLTSLKKLKAQFPDEPRHLRRTCWDLGTRVFDDEANLILPGIFLLGPCFHVFKK